MGCSISAIKTKPACADTPSAILQSASTQTSFKGLGSSLPASASPSMAKSASPVSSWKERFANSLKLSSLSNDHDLQKDTIPAGQNSGFATINKSDTSKSLRSLKKTITATTDIQVKPKVTPGEDAQLPVSPPPEVDTSAQAKEPSLACVTAYLSQTGREPGAEKINQDNCFVLADYITPKQYLFGALDGHGPNGHLVSGYLKNTLPTLLANNLKSGQDPMTAMTKGFLEMDRQVTALVDCHYSGSTAVVSLLTGHTLHTAWVGDSKAILGTERLPGVMEAVALTHDHKPDLPEESARIIAHNGRVEKLLDERGQPIGPYRVWFSNSWVPGLAMSRAIGDLLAQHVGVTPEPEHSTIELTAQDRFLVLASDGVWEFIEPQEAVEIVARYRSPQEACTKLVEEALQRWLVEEEGVVDDITCVVVHFMHKS